jgi:hypothetical protein
MLNERNAGRNIGAVTLIGETQLLRETLVSLYIGLRHNSHRLKRLGWAGYLGGLYTAQ